MSTGLKVWDFPKGSGIRIREKINTSGTEVFGVSYAVTIPSKITGKARIRKQFKTQKEAEDYASDQNDGKTTQGHVFFNATDSERTEFSDVLPQLRKAGVSLREAVEFAIPRLRPLGGDRTISEIVDELRASKDAMYKRDVIREDSWRSFRTRSNQVVLAFGNALARDLTLAEVRPWFESMEFELRTIKNRFDCLAEILNYSRARKYVAENILDGLTKNDRREIYGSDEDKEPEILTPDEAARLLNAAFERPELDLFRAITLGLFCGIRTGELKRLQWEDVRIDEGFVTIGPKVAKKRGIRNVTLSSNAISWLSLCKEKGGPVARSDYRNDYGDRFSKWRIQRSSA
jgi:hypothetical protein